MDNNKDLKKLFKWDEDEAVEQQETQKKQEDSEVQKRKVSKKVLKRLEKEKEKQRKKGILEENKKSKITKKGKVIIIAVSSVIILGIVFWLLFGYFGIGFDLTRTLAKVDDLKVTEKELMTYLDFLKNQNESSVPEKSDPQYDVLRQNLLDSIIVLKLIQKYGKNNGFVITDKDIDDELAKLKSNYKSEDEFIKELKTNKITINFLESQIKNQLLRDKIFAKVTKNINVSDEEVKKYYDDNKETLFTVPEQIKVSHILIKFTVPEGQQLTDEIKNQAKAKIEDIQNQLKNGARFEELAKKYSEDTVSGPQGGDIGFISKGQTIAEFENVAFALQVGQVSDIVQTSYGFHLIKVTDKKESYIKSFEEVKETIKSYLINTKQMKAWEDFVYNLIKQAKIVYTTDLKGKLTDLDKLQQKTEITNK